ncbi:MAG TPA: vWA domain-containing protein [Ilumatobacteraceae bacterium]|nr:vWA domain-containing protein [Ilumatobacteraceae bacterium]
MSRRSGARDSGMGLVEVLISVILTGILITALALSVSVVLRQSDNSTGRVNNARSEQNVSFWMPSDLASADAVDTDPAALPCTLPCPPEANIGGSNALMLTWSTQTLDSATGETVAVTTKVSYRYMQVGTEWVMVRVECTTFGSAPASCSSRTILHELDGPPAGQTFVPGVSTPTWVIQVSQALDPAATGAPGETIPADPTLKNKNGQRVVVTINGGGDFAGAGGGTNQISLSAGGTERKQNLATSDPSGVPPFIAARSRCGGNFALVVDVSGSIGGTNMGSTVLSTPNWATVRGSIYKFIEAFEGTPVKLEVVKFSTSASTLGASGDAQMYFDMLDPAQVTEVKNLVGYPNTSGGLQSGGSTNWEDAVHAVFNKADGTIQPMLPKTVIFFTDGMPTNSRLQTATPTPAMDPADAPLPGPNSTYYQVGWNRANRLMRQYDADVQSLVGMFVGDSAATSPWVSTQGYHLANWQRGYHYGTERGNNVVFERGYHNVYQINGKVVFERSGTGLTYERLSSGVWSSTSVSNYFSSNSTPDSTDGWRVRVTGSLGSWTSSSPTINQTNYEKTNTTADESDGFRSRVSGGLSGSWTNVTQAQYDGSNTTADDTDGWQIVKSYTAPYDQWEPTTSSTYNSNNTAAGETDGWRTRQTAPSTSWTPVSQSEYDKSNTTTDETDGYRINGIVYSAPYNLWEATTEDAYVANNTTSDSTDGWKADKVYSEPFAAYESLTAVNTLNKDILGRFIQPVGVPVAPITDAGGNVTNAATANLYTLSNYALLNSAMQAIALNECGGTLTIQTRLASTGQSAVDPFTYQNSIDQKVVTTTSYFRGGTFDFQTTSSVSPTITLQSTSDLTHYSPVSWSCTAKGQPRSFTTTPIAGGPWQSITVNVAANEAVSCVQYVQWTP